MPLFRRDEELWFRETLFPDIEQTFRVSRILFEETSSDAQGKKLHEIMVLETPRLGRVLTLDGVVQTTEEDEIYYHEPLVHCAAFSCPEVPKCALLIGCDGGTLREIVKHPLKEIDVVDIDRRVIDLAKEYLPFLAQDVFGDSRVTLTIADGAEFVKEKRRAGKKYDLVIIDSPDPLGPARSLFDTSFYLNVAAILKPGGIMIRQTGVSKYQPDEMPSHFRQMLELFPEGAVQSFTTAVPTYIGGYFTLVAASPQKGVFQEALKTLDTRFHNFASAPTLRWYSPDMHRASMVLPAEIKHAVDQTEFGRELTLNLYGCDCETITSAEKIEAFARELCEVIKMKPYGDPVVTPDFGFGKSRTAGLSLAQFIETSLISGHFSKHWRMALLNIFTCSALDVKKAVEFCMEFFKAEAAKWSLELRGTRLLRVEPRRPLFITKRLDGQLVTQRYLYPLWSQDGEEIQP